MGPLLRQKFFDFRLKEGIFLELRKLAGLVEGAYPAPWQEAQGRILWESHGQTRTIAYIREYTTLAHIDAPKVRVEVVGQDIVADQDIKLDCRLLPEIIPKRYIELKIYPGSVVSSE